MIYLFILFILFLFIFYRREGFNLRKKKYDSFFEENDISNDKVNSTLTYRNKSVAYKNMNLIDINEKSEIIPSQKNKIDKDRNIQLTLRVLRNNSNLL